MDPAGVALYPDDCRTELVPEGGVVRATVPRSEISTLYAGVWSPLFQGLHEPPIVDSWPFKSAAFGAQFQIDHKQVKTHAESAPRWMDPAISSRETAPRRAQLDYYPPLTEYVDVAIATPVYVVRFEIGSSRGMGQVVGIKARDPDGAWMQIYEGRAMTEVGKTYKETKRYWQWSAEVCRTHFLASVFRIELDTTAETGIDDWNYIDYAKVRVARCRGAFVARATVVVALIPAEMPRCSARRRSSRRRYARDRAL